MRLLPILIVFSSLNAYAADTTPPSKGFAPPALPPAVAAQPAPGAAPIPAIPAAPAATPPATAPSASVGVRQGNNPFMRPSPGTTTPGDPGAGSPTEQRRPPTMGMPGSPNMPGMPGSPNMGMPTPNMGMPTPTPAEEPDPEEAKFKEKGTRIGTIDGRGIYRLDGLYYFEKKSKVIPK